MIKFEQIGDGTPKDILVVTDDRSDELIEWQEMFTNADLDDSQAALHLAAARPDDAGHTKFVIPAEEAADVADLNLDLADFLEECNRKTIEEAEAKQ